MQSGQLNVLHVHVSGERWRAGGCSCVYVCVCCVCVCGGGYIACESLFFCDLISKSLCVFCWLLEAQDD